MTCTTCGGAGHVIGRWHPELCPACGDVGDIPMHPQTDGHGIPWMLIACIVIPLALVVIAQWGLWSLILPAVFAA